MRPTQWRLMLALAGWSLVVVAAFGGYCALVFQPAASPIGVLAAAPLLLIR